MDMQDKEFDKLFHSKFEDFEVEPSPMVWDNITDELDGKKAKRSLTPWLSIAASVLVLLTAGVLFIQQKDKPAKQQTNNNQVVENHIQPSTTVQPKVDNSEATVVVEQPANRTASVANHTKNIAATPGNTVTVPVTTKVDNSTTQTEPVKTDNAQLIAAVTEPKQEVTQSVVPGKEVQLTQKSTDLEPQTIVEKPVVMVAINKPATTPAKKRGIHSLGGLINVLVAKVDKRQDKLIEFTDGDDDDTESSVTGVNLGVIKIKKQ